MAHQFNAVCEEQGRVGDFIYMSSDPSLFSEGQAYRFNHMKVKAEEYLQEECPHIRPIIMRPGKIYAGNAFEHWIERLPLRKNYTHMDAVVGCVQEQIERVYKEKGGETGSEGA